MAVMVSRTTEAPVPLGDYVPTADGVIVMNGITWEGFESLLALRGERSRPKLAYLDGAVELMTTSFEHETIKSNVGRLVEAYCDEIGVDWSPKGTWTLLGKAQNAGAEPDECYFFGREFRRDNPDLVIEIVWTHGGIDKLEIYRRLDIAEVWFWDNDAISVHRLENGKYKTHARSGFLPGLDLELICRMAQLHPTSEARRQLIAALRSATSDDHS